MTNYKALCVELLREWDNAPTPSDIIDTDAFGVIRKIRTALETEETMTEQHPITLPPELIEDWILLAKPLRHLPPDPNTIATQAARWGADQELEACVEWLGGEGGQNGWPMPAALTAARRPKPPSPKEEALQVLENLTQTRRIVDPEYQALRHALEQLDD